MVPAILSEQQNSSVKLKKGKFREIDPCSFHILNDIQIFSRKSGRISGQISIRYRTSLLSRCLYLPLFCMCTFYRYRSI
jgi:hypothetical protein